MNDEQNRPQSADEHGPLMADHSYDGIQEYDNPMPGWWVWSFILSTVFAVYYYIAIETGNINTYEQDLAESVADLEAIRASYAEAHPVALMDETTLAGVVADNDRIASGQATYNTFCIACHGAAGEGGIGPNMTDAFWINGGSNMDIFNVIRDGVPAKGMAAWKDAIPAEDRASLVAFIVSLQGTEPANAKEAQGELYEVSAPSDTESDS